MYEVSANINEVELLKMPLNADFQIDLEKLGNYLKDENLKLIFICSPNNPTANDILLTSIEFILNNFDGIVIIDEAYIDFSKQISLTQKIAKYPNLIVMQTFSKAWGMAGVRVGMAFSNSEIINYFNKVKPPYNISSLNQQAILEKLNNYQVFENEVTEILSQRTLLINELQKLPKIQKIYPSQANFILIAIENADFVYNELVNQKIVVRNRHKIVANCLRISVGTPQENELLLKALKNI
jgi:histidinol-phosphate aminotransferase